MNVGALYLRELRGWRHRFWWLPLAGTLLTLLPLALIPLRRSTERKHPWEEQITPPFLWPAVPQQALGIVIAALMALTFLLALWLARELRGSEVRDNTLPDLVITTVNALELALAQVAAAWTIAAMLIVGALPVLVPFGARVGRNRWELLLGCAVLLSFPLAGAAIGNALFWWKGLVVIASRGRSFRLWMIPVALLAVTACANIARPLTILWWRQSSPGGGAPNPWGYRGNPGPYSSAMLPTNLVLGVMLLAALWLVVALLLTLWERGRRGRAALCALLVVTVIGSCSHPFVVRVRTRTAVRATKLGQRLAPQVNQRWGPSHVLDQLLERPDLNSYLVPILPLLAGPILFGADLYPTSDRNSGLGTRRVRWDEVLPLLLVLGGLFWLTCALSAFTFALRDASFLFRRPWLIHALRHPELAAYLLEFGRTRKPRVGNYVFATRNPFFDYTLARSGGSRVVLFALFGACLLGVGLMRLRSWEQFVGEQPTPDLTAESGVVMTTTFFLCWLCGVNGGVYLAHLKATRQWWALLGLPVRFRTLLSGLWLPRVLDAGVLVVAGYAAVSMLAALGHEDMSLAEGEHWLYAGLLASLLVLGASTSTFAASWSRGTARATMLTVILSIAVGMILPAALVALIEWQIGRSEPKEWRLHFTPVDSDPALVTILAPIAASVTSCLALLGWGVRRLRRPGA